MMRNQGIVGGALLGGHSTDVYRGGPQMDASGPRELSAFEEVRGAIDALSGAADRASALANRLVGAQPLTATSAGQIGSPVYDGAIPMLHADAAAIRRYVTQINEDLSRIERALP